MGSFVPLETARLRLRLMRESDAGDIHAYQRLADVVEYMFWEVRTLDETREHLARRLQTTGLEQDGDVLVVGVELGGPGHGTAVLGLAGVGSGTGGTQADAAGLGARAVGAGTGGTQADGAGLGAGLAAGADGAALGAAGRPRLIGEITVFLHSVANGQAEIGWAFHPDFQGQGYATEAAGRMLDWAFAELGVHRVEAHLDPRNTASAAVCVRLGMQQDALLRENLHFKGAWGDTAIYGILAAERAAPVADAPSARAVLPVIRVAAVVLVRDRRVLMVTARGRDVLYLPGGKIDPGETSAEALVRECREEIAVELDGASIQSLFTVTVQAHGEPEGRMVAMDLFAATTPDEPTPSAEVDSVHWVSSADDFRCPPAGVETLARLVALDLID